MASSATVVDLSNTDKFFNDVRLRATDVLDEADDVILSMKNVHKTYLLGVEGIPALRGVSVTIRRGEFVVVFGTSGGGKTTMLNLIGTIDKPTKGEMFLCGERITDRTPDSLLAEIRRDKLGFVFQTFNLLGALNAQENVEMPMVLAGRVSAAERAARAKQLLETVGLGARLDHFPAQLSGGEQQRVTIARAIANRPELLLLDEPTGDLDSVNSAIVMDLLTKLHERGLTLVMVTHDVYLKSFADRVVWMRDGKIQRIEKNSDESKRAARQQLADDLAAARAQRTQPVVPAVEIRQPENYETSPDYDAQSQPEHKTFDELDNEAVNKPSRGGKAKANGRAGAASASSASSSSADAQKAAKKKKGKKTGAAAPLVSLDETETSAASAEDDSSDADVADR